MKRCNYLKKSEPPRRGCRDLFFLGRQCTQNLSNRGGRCATLQGSLGESRCLATLEAGNKYLARVERGGKTQCQSRGANEVGC
jgi:hypothetical protein